MFESIVLKTTPMIFFDMAIGQLFEEEKDPIKLIKMKELYATLETATDKAEDAADIIKSIQVKHA